MVLGTMLALGTENYGVAGLYHGDASWTGCGRTRMLRVYVRRTICGVTRGRDKGATTRGATSYALGNFVKTRRKTGLILSGALPRGMYATINWRYGGCGRPSVVLSIAIIYSSWGCCVYWGMKCLGSARGGC